jgi:hypothetical protein
LTRGALSLDSFRRIDAVDGRFYVEVEHDVGEDGEDDESKRVEDAT